jgi:hypothetical protein
MVDEVTWTNVIDRTHTGSTGIHRKVLQGAIEESPVSLASTRAEILPTAT